MLHFAILHQRGGLYIISDNGIKSFFALKINQSLLNIYDCHIRVLEISQVKNKPSMFTAENYQQSQDDFKRQELDFRLKTHILYQHI